jgi:peptidoglycan/LPS O-acetylase OafA/YrhL
MQFRIFGAWRLFAAFLVMSYHFSHYGPAGFEAVLSWFERLLPLLDAFFMISGALIFLRYHDRVASFADYRNYLIKRLARLYPLHLMTTGFFVLIGVALTMSIIHSNGADGGMQRYDWWQLPSNLLLVQGWGFSNALTFNYVSWSLSAEWFCYLLLPIIVIADRKGGMPLMFVLLAITVVLLEASVRSGVMPFSSWMKASTWGAYRAFADFIIGAIAAKAAMQSTLRIDTPWVAWGALLLTCVGMQLDVPPYFSITALGICLFLAIISERHAPERSQWLDVFSPIANVSFGIYLWHPVIEAMMLSFLWRRVIEPTGIIGFYPYLVFPMAITVLVSLLSYQFIERPSNGWILNKAGFKRARPEKTMVAAE